jgi:NAD-dependent deacetylase
LEPQRQDKAEIRAPIIVSGAVGKVLAGASGILRHSKPAGVAEADSTSCPRQGFAQPLCCQVSKARISVILYCMENIKELFTLIKESKHVVAMTGAGVSTLSGIRDFRGKDGLYKEMDAEKIFSIEYFLEDPSFYYNQAGSFIYNIDEKEASIVHIVLGELEKRGLLKALITQNIDLLHQKGGSKNVIEIHGSPSMHYCLRCPGIRVGFDEVAAVVRSGGMPKCPKCERVIKPAITFFGESLPAEALKAAVTESQDADLMLVLGTSLTVYPAASMPEYTLRKGGKIVIVNNQSTPLDSRAQMHFDDLGSVFEGIKSLLDSE